MFLFGHRMEAERGAPGAGGGAGEALSHHPATGVEPAAGIPADRAAR